MIDSRMRLFAVALCVFGCQADLQLPAQPDVALSQGGGQPLGSCDPTTPNSITANIGFTSAFACGDRLWLNFRPDSGGFSASEKVDIKNAAMGWNNALDAAGLNLPRFDTASAFSGAERTIRVVRTGVGTAPWCGQAPTQDSIKLSNLSATGCSDPGTLGSVAMHEMGHTLGFQGGYWHTLSPEPVANCSTVLINDTTPSGQICQWEIEVVYRRYGIRPTAIGPASFNKFVLTGISGLSDRTLAVGDRDTIQATLVFARTPESVCDSGCLAVTGDLLWTIPASAAGVATTTSTAAPAIITANGPGATTVTVVSNTINHDVGTIFLDGVSAAVTVSPPPPSTYTLTVFGSGSGGGTITAPAGPGGDGISCVVIPGVTSLNCSEAYTAGTVVAVQATASQGSTFLGWSGDCSGSGSCQVSMTQPRSVTAQFDVGCNLSPTTFVVPPDQSTTQTLTGPSACASHTVTIEPDVASNGQAGFSNAPGCSLTSKTLGMFALVKVRGCASGEMLLKVKNVGGTVVQVIYFLVGLP